MGLSVTTNLVLPSLPSRVRRLGTQSSSSFQHRRPGSALNAGRWGGARAASLLPDDPEKSKGCSDFQAPTCLSLLFFFF